MIAAAAALRAGASALLAAQGERDAGALVAAADVEIVGSGEPWSMGSRTVTAQRIALVVDAPAYASLASDPATMSAIKAVFGAAMRTPETELADLVLVLRLPSVRVGWHRAYRDAAPSYSGERADLQAVLGGAAALLDASGALATSGASGASYAALPDVQAAAMLRRASLEAAEVPSASFPPLVRYVLRLDPPDLALAQRSCEIGDRLRRAVHDAGTRADEMVSTVELVAAPLMPPQQERGPEALLTRALEAKGITVIPVARGSRDGAFDGDSGDVTLAFIGGGEVRIVEIAAGRVAKGRRSVARGQTKVVSFALSVDEVSDEASASAAAAALCAGIAG